MQSQPRTRALPTPERLKNAALFYLSRYAASAESLRRVLRNRLRRAARDNAAFAADRERQAALLAAIDEIIAAHEATGALNDQAYAEMKVASLRRSGRSGRYIQQKLAVKGIKAGLALAALNQHDRGEGDADGEAAETRAALAYAKKRRLGPFRAQAKAKEGDRLKDFAALARAGFSGTVIRRILHAAPDDRLEGWE